MRQLNGLFMEKLQSLNIMQAIFWFVYNSHCITCRLTNANAAIFPEYLSISIYLSIYLFIYLSIDLPTYLPTYLPIYLSTYLPIYMIITWHSSSISLNQVIILKDEFCALHDVSAYAFFSCYHTHTNTNLHIYAYTGYQMQAKKDNICG